MRHAAILGLVIVAAVLPLIALPLVIVRVESAPIVAVTVVVISVCDAQPVALAALTLFRAPPSL